MILYVNGDSNSSGHELQDTSQSWPVKLSQHLDLELVNHAKAGTSNPAILRNVKNLLSSTADQKKFIVIGWTSWEREEWYFKDQYYDVNAGGHDVLPLELQERYKHWVVEQTGWVQYNKSKLLHSEIYQLHKDLQLRNIPHLFFNAVMPFQHEVLGDPTLGQDWSNCFLYPYLNEWSYYWHLKNQGFVPTAGNHHLDKAQTYWANILYNYIVDQKLL
jgi:hypothetical protein